jgi:hypothetical protein
MDRYELQGRYIELTCTILPSIAEERRWVIRDGPDYMRLVLDHLFEDCWYRHLDRRLRACKQLNTRQLTRAVALAEAIAREGEELVLQMNARSLAWRGIRIERWRPRRR